LILLRNAWAGNNPSAKWLAPGEGPPEGTQGGDGDRRVDGLGGGVARL
jgi:hypothetical protein